MSPAEANKRLTTILMADVVGYSRLMAADEVGTLNRLKTLRKELIIPREKVYRGRTVKLMGDGALMEFANVSDAVNFAMDVQREMLNIDQGVSEESRISYRIGINIGEIIADEGDIYGSGINICARLESICQPGGIYLSEAAYRLVENSAGIRFRWLGEQSLKNIPEAVSIYQVLLEHEPRIPASAEAQRIQGKHLYLVAIILLLTMLGFLTYALLYPGSTPVTAEGPRIPIDQAPSPERAD